MASSEGPEELDCADVVEAVYLYLDGELPVEAIEGIRLHLDECSPCLREYGIEQEVKTLLGRCFGETAPDALRASVLARIQIVRTELSVTGPSGTELSVTELSRTEVSRTEYRID